MTGPQWLGGQPSYSVTVTPAEALEELRSAVSFASRHATSGERVRLAMALAWVEWKLSNDQKEIAA